jgi:hypothetical protein
VTLADTLAQLKDVLVARDEARTRLHQLEAQAKGGGEADKRLSSNLRKQSERLSTLHDRERTLRESIGRETEQSRTAAADLEVALHDLEVRHSSRQVMDAAYEMEAHQLRARRADSEARIAVREKALQAETAKDLDWLDSVPTVHRMAEGGQQPGAHGASSVAPSEWPGASVPERIVMLWRESKKPNSRRSIVVSSIVVGAIAILVLGVVIISSHLNPRDPADYLGVGEFLVPILVDDAQHLRNLELTLEYDNEVVTAVSVVQGDVGRLAVMQYDIYKPGRVEVLLRDVTGIEGTGSILIVRFKTNEIVPGPTALRFASLSAVDSRTMQDMPVQGEDGWVNTGTRDVQSPVIRFP